MVIIGMAGFEPTAPSSRTKCATKLRYIPFFIFRVSQSAMEMGNRLAGQAVAVAWGLVAMGESSIGWRSRKHH